MRTLTVRRWPWFALAGLFAVLGVVVLDGPAAGLACFASVVALLGACIRGLAAADPETVRGIERSGFMGGGLG